MPRKYPQAQTGACILTLVQAARGAAGPLWWGPGLLPTCPGKGSPSAGRVHGALDTLPRRAHLPPEAPFLPLNSTLALLSLPEPQHSPAARRRPRPFFPPPDPPPARPSSGSPPSPRRSAGSSVLAPYSRPPLAGPPRPGPPRPPARPPPGDSGPFHNSAARLPPLGSRFTPARFSPGACALRSAAAAAVAAPSGSVFLKGNAEASGVTVGEGDPESGDPRVRRQTLSRSRKALGGPIPPTPSWGGGGGKWRLGAAEASSGAGGRGGEGGVWGGETRRARPGQGGPKRALGMSSGAAGCELLPLRRRRRRRQQRRRRGPHGPAAGLSRGLHFSARRRDGARAPEEPR